MNEDKKQLQQERIQINRDLNRNVLPKRLPINISLSHPIASSYAKNVMRMCNMILNGLRMRRGNCVKKYIPMRVRCREVLPPCGWHLISRF